MRLKSKFGFKKTFFWVIRTYSWKEKFLSLFLILLIFGLSIDYFWLNRDSSVLVEQQGGRYSEALVGNLVNLNPLFVDKWSADRTVSRALFSGLVKYDPKTSEFIGDLTNFHVSDDKKVYGFRIKEGAKWHDGEDVTADDLFFTFNDVIKNPDFDNPAISANFQNIEVKKIDPMKIEFHLKEPNTFFMSYLVVGVLPQHLLKDVPVSELETYAEFNKNPIGNGPYRIEEPFQRRKDGRIEGVLLAFEDYFGDQPNLSELRFVVYADYQKMLAAKSALNGIEKLPGDKLESFAGDERFSLYSYNLPQYNALFLNMDSPVIVKKKMRLALQKSLDLKELFKLMPDTAGVTDLTLRNAEGEFAYKVGIEEAEKNLHSLRYRFENEEDQFRKNRDGEILKIKVLARKFKEGGDREAENKKVLGFVKESWEKIGIQVELSELEAGEFLAALQARNYDVIFTGQHLGYNNDLYSYWHSSQTGKATGGLGLNLSNYQSFAADKILESIRGLFDEKVSSDNLNALERVIAADVPVIFLYRPTFYYVSDGKVDGVDLDNLVYPADRLNNISSWTQAVE